MPDDQRMQRRECRRGRADLVDERRDGEVDPFPRIALTLPVQRLVLSELVEEHHRKQVAYSDEAGHAFQFEAGRVFQREAGRHSDLKPATCSVVPSGHGG